MNTWKTELQNGFSKLESLLTFLEIPPHEIRTYFQSLQKVQPLRSDTLTHDTLTHDTATHKTATQINTLDFPFKVSLSFASRMKKGDLNDPLLLQVLPQGNEQDSPPNFILDAVGDLSSLKAKGLIQKYKGRALIMMTGACAIHCRYCFRRHFPYSENRLNQKEIDAIVLFLNNNTDIEEVIFSGGDPLILSNEKLQFWVDTLLTIPHLKRWRIHSRLASVLPSRIDGGLLDVLSHFQQKNRKTILVNHINHPNEITDEIKATLAKLTHLNITLLNQSVLLKNINDDPKVLKLLSEKLFYSGVLPYYLHLLDPTKGTHHFEVNESKAIELYQKLLATLPGYLVPKLVREIQGAPSKVPVSL